MRLHTTDRHKTYQLSRQCADRVHVARWTICACVRRWTGEGLMHAHLAGVGLKARPLTNWRPTADTKRSHYNAKNARLKENYVSASGAISVCRSIYHWITIVSHDYNRYNINNVQALSEHVNSNSWCTGRITTWILSGAHEEKERISHIATYSGNIEK